MTQRRNHFDLDGFLAEKLVEWYSDPTESEAEQLRQACKLMTSFIANRPSGEIISHNTSSGAISQFKYALDDPSAWAKIEKDLSEMSERDLDDYQFPDLIHYLTLV